jgi:hypothetical protein
MYDSGANLSQVKSSVAIATGLRHVNEVPQILIRVADSQEPTAFGSSKLFSLPIYDHAGLLITRLPCVSVDYIGELNPVNVSKVSTIFESEYDLDELLQPGCGEIDILVGCNFPELHPNPISTKGNVTLAECRFGLVIYGSDPSFPEQRYERMKPTTYLESAVYMACLASPLSTVIPRVTTRHSRERTNPLPSFPSQRS